MDILFFDSLTMYPSAIVQIARRTMTNISSLQDSKLTILILSA